MKEVKLVLSLEEANLVLSALSKQPFETVSSLIFKIKSQGESQLQVKAEEPKVKEKLKKAE